MILDAFTLLSGQVNASTGALTGQLVTANSTISTNTMDMGPLAIGSNQAGDTGAGEPLNVEFSILAAPATATDVTFQLIQADDAALTTNVQVINAAGPFTIAQLPVGTVIPMKWDRAAPLAPKRYVGARYVATGATITAMSVVAAVAKNVQDVRNIYFRSGFAVS
jgi:hypothetical protein